MSGSLELKSGVTYGRSLGWKSDLSSGRSRCVCDLAELGAASLAGYPAHLGRGVGGAILGVGAGSVRLGVVVIAGRFRGRHRRSEKFSRLKWRTFRKSREKEVVRKTE